MFLTEDGLLTKWTFGENKCAKKKDILFLKSP